MGGISLDRMLARLPKSRRDAVEAKGRALVEQEVTLRTLRQAMGQTQAALAAKLGVKQENVSRIEHRADIMISTLNEYLASLGGRLVLTAEFDGRDPIRLTGLGQVRPEKAKVKEGQEGGAGEPARRTKAPL